MSTYYYFHCTKHKQSGGCWTRQAWGYGNADLIESFKFVMYHIRECGPESIGMHSEHEDNEYINIDSNEDSRREFLSVTADIMPRSNDWEFMGRYGSRGNWKEQWVAEELAEIEEPS